MGMQSLCTAGKFTGRGQFLRKGSTKKFNVARNGFYTLLESSFQYHSTRIKSTFVYHFLNCFTTFRKYLFHTFSSIYSPHQVHLFIKRNYRFMSLFIAFQSRQKQFLCISNSTNQSLPHMFIFWGIIYQMICLSTNRINSSVGNPLQ